MRERRLGATTSTASAPIPGAHGDGTTKPIATVKRAGLPDKQPRRQRPPFVLIDGKGGRDNDDLFARAWLWEQYVLRGTDSNTTVHYFR